MKILYLVDPQSCYLTSMIFEGLCELLGEKSIFVYPMLKRWKYGTPDDWYTLPDAKIGWTGKVDYEIVRPNLIELDLTFISSYINDFDYIILASPREYTLKSFREIKALSPIIRSKIILLDGEDGDNINYQILNEVNPDFIFKREILYEGQYKGKKIYPLPFAAFTQNIPKEDDSIKNLNVFSVFGNTHYLRRRIVEKFHQFNFDNSIVDIDTGVDNWDRNCPRQGKMSYFDYMKKIAHSKIAISCIGHGKDTVRYWEIPSYKTMMMCINPGIVIPFPFSDKENVVLIKNDLSNFQELLEYYLTHDKEREEIAYNGNNHLMKFHTCEKRVSYMLNILEGLS
jgi:hypothetical protein